MTEVEKLNEVIIKHLGTANFGNDDTPMYWARLLIEADVNAPLYFGCSSDSVLLEQLRRTAKNALHEIEQLSEATKRFRPKAYAAWHIRNMLAGKERDVFDEAHLAMSNLEQWILSIREHTTFKQQAKKSRNWRAASVAGTCRILWAAAKWELMAGSRQEFRSLMALGRSKGLIH